MESKLGIAARRAFWLTIALAVLSLAEVFVVPVAGAVGTVLWLAVAWGIRRGQWWAALTGIVMEAIPLATAIVRSRGVDTGVPIASAVVAGTFAVICGFLFLLAARELHASGNGQAKWLWGALLCGYGIFWLCFSAYSMPSASMEPTLLPNESILVEQARSRLGSLLRRDELLVFHYPLDHKEIYVKRVAGVPGDRLKIVNKQLFRNGSAVGELYVKHSSNFVDSYRDNFPSQPNVRLPGPALQMLADNVHNGELVVPPDKYFVLGDNRDDSADSRYWGFVSPGDVIGRPALIYASVDLEQGGQTKSMGTAFNTRWSRLLRVP